MDPTEGGHQILGIYMADFCLPVHPEKATIAKPHMFTVKYFIDAEFEPTDQGVTPKNLIATQTNIIKVDLSSNFYNEQTSVKVSWISNFQEPVPNILNACRTISENLSRIKRESVSKDVFSVIGIMAANFLNSTEDSSLMYRLNFKDHVYQGGNKLPAVV